MTTELSYTIDHVQMLQKELAAAQLHIKELCEKLGYYVNNPSAWGSFDQPVSDAIEQALAKQPDTRALDKALLDAELKGLENIAGREWTGRRKVVKEKLAELNKEPGK